MENSRRFRRGASILPSVFTTGNLFAGFWSIIRTWEGRFGDAALLVGVAVVLDILDGRIARLTGTQSEFGAQLDSLADAVSFGVAPAILAFAWALSALPRVGWPAAFLFAACGVLRLARFNVQRHAVDARYFVGLPIPAAAAQLAAVVFALPEPPGSRLHGVLTLVLVIVLSFLMVSTYRYPSFKGIDLRRRRSYITVVGIALLFLLVASHPELSLLGVTSLYTVSGPAAHAVGLIRRRGAPPVAAPATAFPSPDVGRDRVGGR